MNPDDAALKRFANAIRASNTHYIKLAEAGAAENVVEKKVIYYLAALERKPTGSYSKGIVKGLDYAAQHGSDVGRMKDMYGFSSVPYPSPDEAQTTGPGMVKPPLLSDDDARAAEQWYEKGYKAVYSGFQTEYECYVKALQHNPNLAKAWHDLRQACSAAGRYDLAERCDDAETILASGRFIDNCRTLLEPGANAPSRSENKRAGGFFQKLFGG
jgi:tetratricopeptide (TPR) repeat protein